MQNLANCVFLTRDLWNWNSSHCVPGRNFSSSEASKKICWFIHEGTFFTLRSTTTSSSFLPYGLLILNASLIAAFSSSKWGWLFSSRTTWFLVVGIPFSMERPAASFLSVGGWWMFSNMIFFKKKLLKFFLRIVILIIVSSWVVLVQKRKKILKKNPFRLFSYCTTLCFHVHLLKTLLEYLLDTKHPTLLARWTCHSIVIHWLLLWWGFIYQNLFSINFW